MKFMVMAKATKETEAGVMPTTEQLAAMSKYNEELVKAGVLLTGAGLHPSSKGARVKFSGEQRIVTDGPFIETKELIAGYGLWQCASLAEAIELVKRSPMTEGAEIEIRQVLDPADFGEALTPELLEQVGRIFAQAEKLQQQA